MDDKEKYIQCTCTRTVCDTQLIPVFLYSFRSYWIADMSWLADGLLLACMTKRGALVVLPRFGQPLKLITSGNSLEMGPAAFLPLHPLIIVTYVYHIHLQYMN